MLCFTHPVVKNYHKFYNSNKDDSDYDNSDEDSSRKKNQGAKVSCFTATSAYHALDQPILQVMPTLLTQVSLFTIYIATISNRGRHVKIDSMFYIITVFALFMRISPKMIIFETLRQVPNYGPTGGHNSLPLSVFFWRCLHQFSSARKHTSSFVISTSVDDKSNPVSFVLNLVTIFVYGIALDDIPENKQKEKLFNAAEKQTLLGAASGAEEDEEKDTEMGTSGVETTESDNHKVEKFLAAPPSTCRRFCRLLCLG